jgi:RTX calcium-binding nonapeptide repeat (4 copies)
MNGGAGNDTYFVDNAGDVPFENANEGTDSVFASVGFTLTANVEALVLQGGGNISGTGNTLANSLFGNAGNNTLDGGGGADQLTGNGGNDTFVFRAGQAGGDNVIDFAGNGAAAGDSLQFVGFGTTGATFTQAGVNLWQIHSGLDAHNEFITSAPARRWTRAILSSCSGAILRAKPRRSDLRSRAIGKLELSRFPFHYIRIGIRFERRPRSLFWMMKCKCSSPACT